MKTAGTRYSRSRSRRRRAWRGRGRRRSWRPDSGARATGRADSGQNWPPRPGARSRASRPSRSTAGTGETGHEIGQRFVIGRLETARENRPLSTHLRSVQIGCPTWDKTLFTLVGLSSQFLINILALDGYRDRTRWFYRYSHSRGERGESANFKTKQAQNHASRS